MNIPVQKNIPARNQGRPGDMVLVVHSTGMYLYVKGDNSWGSLLLNTQGVGRATERNKRRRFQESVREIIEHDGASVGGTVEHGRGTIAGGGGGQSQPEISSGGHEPR